ncbi:MAG: hypothetical protein K2Y71_27005 [Xanthobacteraceae bacterium]|nr:hypothetical protein [Xanthobacteraceae bacterium]
MSLQRDLATSTNKVADALLSLKRMEEATKALLAGLAIVDRYSATDPENLRWQIDLVLSLNKLALAGDEPRTRDQRARTSTSVSTPVTTLKVRS